jgi:hypothetical protein
MMIGIRLLVITVQLVLCSSVVPYSNSIINSRTWKSIFLLYKTKYAFQLHKTMQAIGLTLVKFEGGGVSQRCGAKLIMNLPI